MKLTLRGKLFNGRRVDWLRGLVLSALCCAGIGAMPATHAAILHAQPALLALAAQRPANMIGLIVQKTAHDNSVEQQVAALGGKVTADLHIINAFAAALPAQAVPTLAQSAGVRWVSLDSAVAQSDAPLPTDADKNGKDTVNGAINVSKLTNTYIREIGADKIWNASPYYQGQAIGVAVVDSGMNYTGDFYTNMGVNRIVANVHFNGGYNQTTWDGYGHGTHVGGIIGGNGNNSSGTYIGVAPGVNLVNVKVSDDTGAATASKVVSGLQWINDNRTTYNIRVVNLSLNSSVASSYNNDPIDAAAEILWFNKVVVVASAGNNGSAGALYSPANDPFVITVGAVDDRGTNAISDDTIASFSSYGTTSDGFAKPDLMAPGTNIVSVLSSTGSSLPTAHADHIVKYNGASSYFRMSGTSMAAPMVAGAAALLLQANPNMTPDQIKYRLKSTANKSWSAYKASKAGAGLLDVYAAVRGTTTQSANTGLAASHLLWTGGTPVTWNSVNWNSVNWNSVNWNSVNWNSVNWNSVNWNSDYWGN